MACLFFLQCHLSSTVPPRQTVILGENFKNRKYRMGGGFLCGIFYSHIV